MLGKPIVKEDTQHDGRRFYYSDDGLPYISTTTLLSYFEDQTNLRAWQKKEGLEAATKITQDSIAVGKLSHTQIEEYLESGNIGEDLTPYATNAINNFYGKCSALLVEEAFLYEDPSNPVIRFAGRLDQLLTVEAGAFRYNSFPYEPLKELVVIADLKTKRKPVRLDRVDYIFKYCLQGAAYAHAVSSLSDYQVDGSMVVVVTKTTCKLLYLDRQHIEFYWNIFNDMLHDYYRIRPINKTWKELVSEASLSYDEDSMEVSSNMPHLLLPINHQVED